MSQGLTLYLCFLVGPSKESLSLFCINPFSIPSHLRFTRMVSVPKRYQSYQIGSVPSEQGLVFEMGFTQRAASTSLACSCQHGEMPPPPPLTRGPITVRRHEHRQGIRQKCGQNALIPIESLCSFVRRQKLRNAHDRPSSNSTFKALNSTQWSGRYDAVYVLKERFCDGMKCLTHIINTYQHEAKGKR